MRLMQSLRLALLVLLAAASTAASGAPPAQRYRLVGQPDVASELILHPDGRFQYFLAAGALDEHAEGRWTRDGKIIRLTTMPRPRPAAFSAGSAGLDPGAPFTVKVTWPDGRGIAGVDLPITFDRGDPAEGYTQEYGWSIDPAETRTPRTIMFAVQMHGLRSQPFPVDPARANRLTFILTPNDLGTVDFDNLPLTVTKDRVIMPRGAPSPMLRSANWVRSSCHK